MLGTSPETKGGISSVIDVYRQYGLFERFPLIYIATHREGSSWAKLRVASAAFGRFVELLLKRAVGVVHAHAASGASFWRKSVFILAARCFRVPVILHLHGGEFRSFYESSRLGKWFVRSIFRGATRVVALSHGWRQWIEDAMGIRGVVTLYNPIPLPAPETVEEQREPWILFLGRLGKGKGVYDLIDAIATIAPRNPDLVLLLAGDGEIEEAKAAVAARGIGNHVKILGWVGGEEKRTLLKKSALFVLPSYNEGLPMSILEAMSNALPVVSTPVGGIPEAVKPGVTGILVEPGDVAALAGAIERLLRDPELRRRYGLAGREVAEQEFSMDKLLPKLEGLYGELGVRRVERHLQMEEERQASTGLAPPDSERWLG